MQAQMASFLATRGQMVIVMDPSTMVPIPEGEGDPSDDPDAEEPGAGEPDDEDVDVKFIPIIVGQK